MQGKRLDIGQVFDVRALRVIVDDTAACYAALARVPDDSFCQRMLRVALHPAATGALPPPPATTRAAKRVAIDASGEPALTLPPLDGRAGDSGAPEARVDLPPAVLGALAADTTVTLNSVVGSGKTRRASQLPCASCCQLMKWLAGVTVSE